ncbi:MAG TPA: class I SAM-dependent methyltransferase [Thermoanaerobaculia bacterium]|nr:class I SAM-dependent methyltransferase [Thermoanaerobaculia bacterium]
MQHYPFKAAAGSSHRRLIGLIPLWCPKGGRFVDLGAFGGEVGGAVRSHFGTTTAVERDPDQMATLAARYDRVVIADLEQIENLPGPLDAVLLADVLEHLRAPEELLSLAAKRLAPGGRIFISIPNVANLAIRLQLLLGRFEYQDRGILDRTHVRFYTRKTARRLIESAGLTVLHEAATPVPIREAFPAWPWFLVGLLEAIALMLTPVWPTLFGYQFIFVTEKK